MIETVKSGGAGGNFGRGFGTKVVHLGLLGLATLAEVCGLGSSRSLPVLVLLGHVF